MDYIEKKDNIWHPLSTSRPCFGIRVEVKGRQGGITRGRLMVDMSGWYFYNDDKNNWDDIDDYTYWRFVPDEDYSGYEKMCTR